jgi:DNA-binding transcriptional regulator LsrR (DeoR family)
LKLAQLKSLVAGYQAGRTMKELAAEFGIDRRTVSTHLRRAGVRSRRGGLDQEQAVDVARLYEAGWSSGRLAERYSVSSDNVLRTLRAAGVKIRPRRGGPRTSYPTS